MKSLLLIALGASVVAGLWWLHAHAWVWSGSSFALGVVAGVFVGAPITFFVANIAIANNISRRFGW